MNDTGSVTQLIPEVQTLTTTPLVTSQMATRVPDPSSSWFTVAVSVTEPPAGDSDADATSCTRVGAGLACTGADSHPNVEDSTPPPAPTGADTAGRRLNRTASDKHAEMPRNLTCWTLALAV